VVRLVVVVLAAGMVKENEDDMAEGSLSLSLSLCVCERDRGEPSAKLKSKSKTCRPWKTD
jgi:hypothetical protein